MMEAEIMEQLISYWKDHPDIKQAFESGNRVLLGPFFIPVRHLFFVFAFFLCVRVLLVYLFFIILYAVPS